MHAVTIESVPGHPSSPSDIVTTKLDDGREVDIRSITPADQDAEREFIMALSPQARRYRFLVQIGEPSEELLERLTRIDHVNDEAFIALARNGQYSGRIVGVSRYSVSSDPTTCEISLVVLDDYRPSDLKRVLLDRLIAAARAQGLTRMISVDSADNRHMRAFAPENGFSMAPDPEDATQVVYTLAI